MSRSARGAAEQPSHFLGDRCMAKRHPGMTPAQHIQPPDHKLPGRTVAHLQSSCHKLSSMVCDFVLQLCHLSQHRQQLHQTGRLVLVQGLCLSLPAAAWGRSHQQQCCTHRAPQVCKRGTASAPWRLQCCHAHQQARLHNTHGRQHTTEQQSATKAHASRALSAHMQAMTSFAALMHTSLPQHHNAEMPF